MQLTLLHLSLTHLVYCPFVHSLHLPYMGLHLSFLACLYHSLQCELPRAKPHPSREQGALLQAAEAQSQVGSQSWDGFSGGAGPEELWQAFTSSFFIIVGGVCILLVPKAEDSLWELAPFF